ncbi:D-alanyl-D-alanine carboxypeptidase family protein [Lacisediminihabitans sp. H27-G8]|uniref:D-alanyl-D-alanine carboxypeptidase family protein n=1 Tax=Lacisediminihabitans sp. H27-G8 TaxID=3111909 RepID=UPI0038FD2180
MSVNEILASPVRRRPTRGVVLRRRAVLISASALVIALGIYLPLTLLAPLGSTAARVLPFSAPDRVAASPALPSYGASAIGVIGYPEASASAGSTAPLPIASISKIVTSLVVLEAKPLSPGDSGPTITFTAADAALRAKYVALNGETKPMAAGSTISQLDLMRVTLVASANNYADALTGWAFGSRGAFQIAVTAWLGSHGLDHTTIVEPTGINPGNVSTAADLVEIGKLALANPVISQIVSTPTMTLAGVGTFANTNTLLGRLGVDGIKTGTLNGSSNLLFAARYDYAGHSVTVVGAVVGATDHQTVDATVTTLLAGVKAGFHVITLAKKGQPFANFTTAWSQKARAVSTKTASVLVWSNTPVTAVITALPATVGQNAASAGAVTFTAGGQSVRVPLALDHGLVDPGPWWRLGNPTLLLR